MLEFAGSALIMECKVCFQQPRLVFSGVNGSTLIVRLESFFQVGRETNVAVFRVTLAAQQIDIKHFESRSLASSFAPAELRRTAYAASQLIDKTWGVSQPKLRSSVGWLGRKGVSGGCQSFELRLVLSTLAQSAVLKSGTHQLTFADQVSFLLGR